MQLPEDSDTGHHIMQMRSVFRILMLWIFLPTESVEMHQPAVLFTAKKRQTEQLSSCKHNNPDELIMDGLCFLCIGKHLTACKVALIPSQALSIISEAA